MEQHVQTSLSIQEVSKRLNRPISFLRMEIKYGNLPAYKCGGKKNREFRVLYMDFIDYVVRTECLKNNLKGM